MADRTASTAVGFSGSMSWVFGGAVGGLVGSALFGLALWLVQPTIVTETVPQLYGVDPGAAGWAFHLAHGVVLGVVFGFLVTRPLILGTLSADVETGFIAAMGLHTRFALAGLVYGLAVWAVLPVIAQTLWVVLGGFADPVFPAAAFETLVGHLLYGLLLGGLFSLFVAVGPESAAAESPFDEAVDGGRDGR
ncbi:hypothetical protein [Halovivax gelatinilyticus]|uniref:hypothetical protein n=1 Tax=Halovivax gelatinilyticus TaxID=2961597 RepID=UPI0020CA6197|nr:hypothetical protein [Halovivax gelatinilyticus]